MARNNLYYADMRNALKPGIEMPVFGLGVFRVFNHDIILDMTKYAKKTGFDLTDFSHNKNYIRHIFDKVVTERDRNSQGNRSELPFEAYNTAPVFTNDLDNWEPDYIYLHLIHFHAPPVIGAEDLSSDTWVSITKIHNEANVRAIGASNFQISHLLNMTDILAAGPITKEIEWSPWAYQPEVIRTVCNYNMSLANFRALTFFSPGLRISYEESMVRDIAKHHKTSYAHVVLVWAIKRGFAVCKPLPAAYKLRRGRCLYFQMSDEELAILDSVMSNSLQRWNCRWMA